jgi:putative transposase
LYYRSSPVSADDLRLMRWLDEQFLKTPFYGSRRMVAVMRRDGLVVNRKRVKRLMRLMGIEAIYQKPSTSLRHPAHKVYPYLLRGLVIDRPNQVWCADITYVPMAKGFVYLVAVMDWFSRRVLSWRVSITMDSDFCVEALKEAMEKHGRPEIFNTDQGVQPQCSPERTHFCSSELTQRVRMDLWSVGETSRYPTTCLGATIPLFDCRNHSSAPTWVPQDMTSDGGQ